ncbi:MAG TPA: phosphoribosylglycinamide formyltransferase [Bacillota bacterium]|nr:phosphoribosylglycinamide formyltransferase [Bacillota bacterium]HQE02144.1 phosphoribosylglycinamide formyltransferase [Bacillota bacterium]
MSKYRVAVLASGAGSNLQALIDQVHRRGVADIVLVASDNPRAGALTRARRAGIPVLALAPRRGEGREGYHRRLARAMAPYRPDLVVLAGYMRLLPREFIGQFAPIINVHPSLLPAFPGLDAPAQALARGVKLSGCTVHLVDEGMDTGPILLQEAVPVLPGDSPETLHARIKVQEHRLLVQAVTAFARDQVKPGPKNESEEVAYAD